LLLYAQHHWYVEVFILMKLCREGCLWTRGHETT